MLTTSAICPVYAYKDFNTSLVVMLSSVMRLLVVTFATAVEALSPADTAANLQPVSCLPL